MLGIRATEETAHFHNSHDGYFSSADSVASTCLPISVLLRCLGSRSQNLCIQMRKPTLAEL